MEAAFTKTLEEFNIEFLTEYEPNARTHWSGYGESLSFPQLADITPLTPEYDSFPSTDELFNLPQNDIISIKSALSKHYKFLLCIIPIIILILGLWLPGMLGYSLFNVVSESMQREIPKGSLILTKRVDAKTIEIGDNITYLTKEGDTVTHKVVGIIENCGGSSSRAFKTQGTENSAPDFYNVHEENVVGIVILHYSQMGKFLRTLKAIFIVVLAIVILFTLYFFLQKRFTVLQLKKQLRIFKGIFSPLKKKTQ